MNTSIFNIFKELLTEQTDKISIIRKAILEKLPVSIYYFGPLKEVKSGQRIDIFPVVMGKNKKSGREVIWAYVFKGVTKTGNRGKHIFPGWRMFRTDRIKSAKINPNLTSFDLEKIPGYETNKILKSITPEVSASEVQPTAEIPAPEVPTPKPPTPEIPAPKIEPTQTAPQEPTITPKIAPITPPQKLGPEFINTLRPKIKDINGQNTISVADYEQTVKDLAKQKEDQRKTYQRMISGNLRTGQGTRANFYNLSKQELDNLLKAQNITISDEQPQEQLAEITKRFKALIS